MLNVPHPVCFVRPSQPQVSQADAIGTTVLKNTQVTRAKAIIGTDKFDNEIACMQFNGTWNAAYCRINIENEDAPSPLPKPNVYHK